MKGQFKMISLYEVNERTGKYEYIGTFDHYYDAKRAIRSKEWKLVWHNTGK
jgi:hypothetical protein